MCILDIDVQGVRACRRKKLQGVYVFIAPPSAHELERRLKGRGTETKEQVGHVDAPERERERGKQRERDLMKRERD